MPFIQSGGQIIVDVPAGQKILITSYGAGQTKVSIGTNPSQFPESFIDTVVIENNLWLSPVFSSLQEVKIDAAICEVEYVIGVSPVATKYRFQPTAVAITGGSINGTTIGQATPSSGSFTNLIASGNIGIGVTPSAWFSTFKGIDQPAAALYSQGTTNTFLTNNAYLNSGATWIYKSTAAAHRYDQGSGGHQWFIAPSGTAGNAITFTHAMTLDARGNLGLGSAPSDWGTGRYRGFQLLSSSVAADNGTDADFGFNFYRDSVGAYRYSGTGGNATARTIRMDGAGFKFFSAPPGPEGSPITFTQAMALTNNGNLLVGGQADSGNRACFSYETNGGAAGLKLTSATRDTSEDNVSAIEIIGNSTYGRIFNIQGDGQIEISPLGIARFKINNNGIVFDTQPTPDAVNATATLTTTNLSKKIITSTTAAAVTATLPTGTLMDGAFGTVSDLAFNWTVINTGPNAFTLAVGTGHTIVGNAAVATNTSGTFRSRRTSATTWVSYRIS